MSTMALAAMGPSALAGFGSLAGTDYAKGYMTGIGAPGGGTGSSTGMSTLGTVGAVMGGLQTLGNLWGAWQANKMAKKQFKFTKQMTNINLANQMKAYNTALMDRARSRAVMEGQTQAEMDAYVANNSLSKNGYKDGKTYTGNNAGSGSLIPASYANSISGWSGAPAASSAAPAASSGGAGDGGLGGFGSVLANRAAAAAASSGSGSGASASRAASEDDTK